MTDEHMNIRSTVLVNNKIQIKTITPTGLVKIKESMTIPTAGGVLSNLVLFGKKPLQSQAIHFTYILWKNSCTHAPEGIYNNASNLLFIEIKNENLD